MDISGAYELVSSERYDAFLKSAGVGMIHRNIASRAHPTIEYHKENGKWTQKTITKYKCFQIEFVSGEEFVETLGDGRKSKSRITIEGNTLTHRQQIQGFESVTVRVFTKDDMITTFTIGDVVATRAFQKL